MESRFAPLRTRFGGKCPGAGLGGPAELEADVLRRRPLTSSGGDEVGLNPDFRLIGFMVTCLGDSAIRINAIPSSRRARPAAPGG